MPSSRPKPWYPRSSERLLEVSHEVIDCLDPDGKADQVGRHLKRTARRRRMRHAARVLDEGLDSAEGLTKGEDLGARADVHGLLLAAGNPERHHAAEVAHLTRGHLVAAVTFEARVEDLGDPRMAHEQVDDGLRVGAMTIHAYAEGLDASQDQP